MAESGLQPYKGGYYLWKYIPSLPAAVIFTLLFLALTALHCWRVYKTRLWLGIWFAIGGLMEFIGYAARCSASSNTGKLMPYIIQNTFLLLPPVLFAASVYMTLGRIIRSVGPSGERYSPVGTTWLTRVFVAGDAVAFCIQGGAAGLMATGGEKAGVGEKIIIGGLVVQVVMFGLFVVTAGVFHWRYERHAVGAVAYGGGGWREGLVVLYGVSGLIMARSVFRVAEFSMGQDGYPLTHEWTLYVFDSVLMLGAMLVFYVWHPSKLKGSTARDRIDSGLVDGESGMGMQLKTGQGQYH
ncbi:RTA1 like protein-domain-containing protein [Lasiosphaeria hispida]|uniref:RTA1 like protein-domain-containing protein n=1 Tax=Lasiosphaeria hispida TaxID=260671 RepID=A0AAJ0HB45_9PEZI|nr:RTA1 like protein-domain-containing protein [Lasiosphaeria hispida]